MTPLKSHIALDAHVRWFHWVNVLCVLGLIAVGLAILNDKALGVDNDGKILLKTVHVWIGYVFVFNLAWRLVRAFMGPAHSRWRGILPGGQGYGGELRRYIAGLRTGKPLHYVGHSPPGRIAATLILLTLLGQAVTGLILAGTDLFLPPLGGSIARLVAAPGVDPGTLVPYAPEMYDAARYAAMRAWRAPIVEIHEIGFYVLLALVVLHVIGVVVTEIRAGGGLVSAMFTGKKVLPSPPVDDASANPTDVSVPPGS